ncbi:extracellular solute-binding protein [Paenibacillus sp. Soil522]|uniref:extracellular solute-binding protein n=1 Tax=Paenibacillus sp. Soil522 TaxID=1736388 RepID=UPI0006FD19D7|nr:extracellular solute-binding protein [Paenibacillus sp. Soil522]KRE45389.1 hypothetical protein ASG81_13345 [Paenibacillus sp. Soil522]
MKRRWFILTCLLTLFINACSDHAGTSREPSIDAAVGELDFSRMVEPVTLRVGMPLPAILNNPVVRYIEELSNVKVVPSWEAEGADSNNQMVELAIASKDLPDAMIVNRSQLRKLAEMDMIQDLGAVYETYASKLVKDIYASKNNTALQAASIGGKLYALPNATFESDSHSLLWVRQDWLDKLHLPPPRTLTDVEQIAQAFINMDPDGDGKDNTIGLCGYRNIVYGKHPAVCGFDSIFHAFGAFPKNWIKDSTGRILYGSIMPENKKALSKLADWYKRGLIDNQFALNKNIHEPIVSNKSGLFFGPWWAPYWPLGDFNSIDPSADWKAYPVPLNEDGKFVTHIAPVMNSYLVVRKGYPHPEAVVKVLNIETRLNRKQDPNKEKVKKLEDELLHGGAQLRNYFPIDHLLDFTDAIEKRYVDVESVFQGKKDPASLDVESRLVYESIVQEKAHSKSNDLNSMAALAFQTGVKVLVTTPMVKVRGVFYDTTDSMPNYWSELERLENDTFLKIVMGELPVEAFDDYVKTWMDSGGGTITDEVKYTVTGK